MEGSLVFIPIVVLAQLSAMLGMRLVHDDANATQMCTCIVYNTYLYSPGQ